MYHPSGNHLMIVSWVLCAIASLVVGARTICGLTVLKISRRPLIWSGHSSVFGIIAVILATLAINNGLGSDISDLTPHETSRCLLFAWLSLCFCRMSIGFGKMSVVDFILQLKSRRTSLKEQLLLWLLGASNIVANGGAIGFMMVQCWPRRALWDGMGACDHRVRSAAYGVFVIAWGGASDAVMAIWPSLTVAGLQMSRLRKIVLIALMGLVFLVAVFGSLVAMETMAVAKSDNQTKQLAGLLFWTMVETWASVLTSSVPSLKGLVNYLVGAVKTLTVDRAKGQPVNRASGVANWTSVCNASSTYSASARRERSSRYSDQELGRNIVRTSVIDIEFSTIGENQPNPE